MRCGRGLNISDPTNGEGSPPTTNKYARRGDIAFIGGGAILVIGLWIVGGLAYFDTFHTSPPKPVAEKPTPSQVAEKPSHPAVAEKPAAIADKPSAATKPAEPTPPEVVATDNSPKPPEPQSSLTSPAVTPPLASPPVVEDKEVVEPAARELITRGWALYSLPYTPVRWQEARRDFERALELDSRSGEARIGLASILSTKLADGWSPVLQEDIPRAEHLLSEAVDRGVFRTGPRLTLRSGFFARSRTACPKPRASSRRRFRSTRTTPGPICISERRDCISVSRRWASRHLNRRSGLVRMIQTLPLPIGHWAPVSFCRVEWIKRLICCKRHVPPMFDRGCHTYIWPGPMV